MVFCGQMELVTLWLVLPGHLTQGLVRVVVLVMCSVMTLGVGHCVMEADLVPELIDVPFRKGAELEETTPRDDVDAPVRKGTELVDTDTGRDETVCAIAEELLLRKMPSDDWLGKVADPDGWPEDEDPVRKGAELVGIDTGREDDVWATAALLVLRKMRSDEALGKLADPEAGTEDDEDIASRALLLVLA